MIKSWTAEKLKVEDKKQISQSGIPVWEKERYYNPAGMDVTDNIMNPYNPRNELYKLNEDNRPWIYKHLPGTTEVGEELLVNPLSIPQKREKPTEPFARATVELMGPRIANPILDAFGSIKDAFKAEVQNIKDLVQPPQKKMSVGESISEGISTGLKTFVTGPAGIVFSPISAFFAAADEIPVVGTASRLVQMPFSIAGEGASAVAGAIIDEMDISDAAKEKLKPGIQETFALAAQLALGKAGELGPKKIDVLIKKYGASDAGAIVSKAFELSKEYPKATAKDLGFETKPVKETRLATDKPKAKPKVEVKAKETPLATEAPRVLSKAEEKGMFHVSNQLEDITKQGLILGGYKTNAKVYKKLMGENPSTYFWKNLDAAKGMLTSKGESRSKGAVIFRVKPEGINKRFLSSDRKFGHNDWMYKDNIKPKFLEVSKDSGKTWTNLVQKKAKVIAPKEIEVPRSQIPVGKGKEKLSKLEARVTKSLEKTPDEVKEQLGSTYTQMNKLDQIRSAATYVMNNPDKILPILEGKIEPPKGVLKNSIYVAAEMYAMDDIALARKLASLSSTRAGQELSILTEVAKDSPVQKMTEVVRVREKAIETRLGKTVDKAKASEVGKIKKELAKKTPTKQNWESFIESIKCK